ncbi:MAG: hypothetical protein FGM40_04320 [Rhodocyclaceae bacterium]|nr:hypothetical protein [Rhodocyclaceae bacterium]
MSRWRGALQWGAGLALLAMLAWQLDAGDVTRRLLALQALPFGLGLAAAILANLLSALRWRRIAADLGCVRPTDGFLVRYAQGVSLNTVLPGATLGGDAWRSAWLTAPGFPLARAALTVLLDRVTGLWMLALLALLAVPWSDGATPEVLCGVLAGVVVAPLALCLRPATTLARRIGLPGVLAPLWRHAATSSLGVQALSALALWSACAAVGFTPGPAATLVLAGGLFIAAALPASVFGFGSREAAAAWLFPLFGIDAGAGVAASIAFGLLGTLQGVLYLPLWWRRH